MRHGLVAAAVLVAVACGSGEKVETAAAGLPGADAGGVAADAGTVKTACDGLVPTVSGTPLVVDVGSGNVNATPICSAARSDEGTGTVPLRFASYHSSVGGSYENAWVFYRSTDAAVLGRR